MKTIIRLSALLLFLLITDAASAQQKFHEVRRHTREIRSDKGNIRSDKKDRRADLKAVRRDKKGTRQDYKELARDRRRGNTGNMAGDKVGLKDDRNDLVAIKKI